MNERNYYGTGAKFPLQVNKATGRFMTSTGDGNVKESIYLILMTNKGERLMRKDYGTRLMSYTFENTNVGLERLFAAEIQSDITKNEPRVSNVNVSVDSQRKQGCLFINIDYTVDATGSRENMVFPFYLDNELTNEEE